MNGLAPIDALVQLSFKVQQALGEVADEHDVSLVQMRLLGILRDREPGMLELAGFLGLDKSSVTGLVTRAELRGLVQRSGREGDRRSVLVALTEGGRAFVAVAERQVRREIAKLVAGLDDDDKEQLASLASRVVGGSGAA
jgi:DNA-binding MarR family transcriptional regulator